MTRLTRRSIKRNKFTYFVPNLNSKLILFVINEYLAFSVEGSFWNRHIHHLFYFVRGGLIGVIHNPILSNVFPNWHHAKEHWVKGTLESKFDIISDKLYRIYELRDMLSEAKFLSEGLGLGPGFFSISPPKSIVQITKYAY